MSNLALTELLYNEVQRMFAPYETASDAVQAFDFNECSELNGEDFALNIKEFIDYIDVNSDSIQYLFDAG